MRAAGFAACADWPRVADACYWISANGWRDANPFQRHYNTAPVPGYHLGADWNFGSGAAELPVSAVADGIISSVQPDVSGWGNIVFIRHNTPWGIYTSMYAHVNWASFGMPLVDQNVAQGQQIAVMANANGSYALPLHLEIRAAVVPIRTGIMTNKAPAITNRSDLFARHTVNAMKVLVIDDHALIREAFARRPDGNDDTAIVDASDCRQACAHRRTRCDKKHVRALAERRGITRDSRVIHTAQRLPWKSNSTR
jgi:murein DD-endopeptidase MepM/ murein hydrolase activator NlpD